MSERLALILAQRCSELSFNVSDEQQGLLLNYVALLHKWNKTYNLTAVRDPEEMLVQHILDSLVIVPFIHAGRLLDIGSGAGLPGIPVGIMRPSVPIVVLDSNIKKTRFMQQAVAELHLSNVKVVHSRIEDYSPEQCFDTVVSRAFTQLEQMLELSAPFLCETGVVQAMKGPGAQAEQQQLPPQWQVLEEHRLSVPGMSAERFLLTAAYKSA